MHRQTNSWQKTFAKLGFCMISRRSTSRRGRNHGYRRALRGELLEERSMLTTWFVDNLGDVVDGNVSAGQRTLREAINGAAPNDTIKFAVTGTIQLTDQPGTNDEHLVINKSLTIEGPGANLLTIKAYDVDADEGNGDRVFNIDDGTATNQVVTISGVTLTGGDLDLMSAFSPQGGAIRLRESLNLVDSVISNNNARAGSSPGGTYFKSGGGIFADLQNSAVLTISGSQFIGNSSKDSGGGLFVKLQTGSSLNLLDSQITGGNNASFGGGAFVFADDNTSVNVARSTISDNLATGTDGGGLFITARDGVAISITDSIISGNTAASFGANKAGDGGGIMVRLGRSRTNEIHAIADNTTLTMERSVVTSNHAKNRGGGMYVDVGSGATVTISDSRVTGNDAGLQLGGGIDPTLQVMNPNSGGGMYAYMFSGDNDEPGDPNPPSPVNLKAHLTISGSTIDDNKAGLHGGGIMLCTKRQDSTVAVRSEFGVYNTTISGNFADAEVNPSLNVTGEGGGVHIAFFQSDFPPYAADIEGVDVRFQNVTVTENRAAKAGGIFSLVSGMMFPIDHNDVNDTRLNNTIVSGNFATDVPTTGNNLLGSFNVVESHNNLIGDNVVGVDPGHLIFDTVGTADIANPDQWFFTTSNQNIYNSSNNPGLNALADNGGAVLPGGFQLKTRLPALTSPSIDAGSDAWAIVPFSNPAITLAVDQRRFDRTIDVPTVNNGPGRTVDIGAVEYSGTQDVILVTTLVDELNLSNGPQNVSLRDALAMAAQDGSTGDNDIIRFAPTLFASGSGTITIASSLQQMTIDSNVTVEGPSAEVLAISGNSQKKLFSVNSGVKATVSGMTLANAISANGGAIFSQGDLTLDGVAMLNNYSVTTGGAIQATGALTIFNSSIYGNNASYAGGGIFFQGTSLLVFNSTISSNSTSSGAGIYTTGSTQIVNSTIANNTAAAQGGGISINNGASVLLSNTIVATNKGNGGVENNFFGNANTNSSYNLIGNGGTGGIANERTSGKFNIVLGTGETAGLAQLANVGGTVPTHALVTGSLAIDAGNDSLAKGPYGQPLTTDERGFQRIVDVDAIDPVERAVDVGAFEFRAPIVVNSLADDGNNRKLGPGELTLRDALYLTDELSGDDTIRFSSSLFGTSGTDPKTITILYNGSGTSELMVNNNVTIDGPGANIVTVSGNNQSRVFKVAVGVTASINGMTITRGVNGSGGAIYSQGNLTLNRDTISTSYAVVSGGGVYATGNLTLRDSTVAGNTSGYEGGAGITFAGSSLSITNSTLSGNVTNYGNGGGVRTSGNTVVINSTIAGNFANSNGGGIAVVTGGSLLLHNSIVADNSKGIGVEDNISGLANSLSSHNLIGNGGTGGIINQRTSGNFNIVLTGAEVSGLNRLANYGGPTSTKALLAGSLAIDAGNNAVALAYGLVFDQRGPGFSRNADGNDDSTPRVDIGAFELGADEYFGSL